ncbi:tight junction protein 1 isoform X2 [Ciona intestinalis]
MESHKPMEDLRSASPLSPDPDSAASDGDMMVFPVKNREPKTVVLKKTRWNNSYGLKLGTRIFIQDIQPGSLADKSSDISAGDTILMINGRNVDNKSVQEAIQIIGLSKDKVTMLVKKQDGGTVSIPAERFRAPAAEPDKHEEEHKEDTASDEESDHSRRSSISKESEPAESPVVPVQAKEPKVEPKSDKKQFGGIRVLPMGNAAAQESSSDSESSRSTPEPAPRSKSEDGHDPHYSLPPAEEESGPVLPPTARNIDFIKGKNVGIRLAGGNDVGIFVASVQENSPAAKKGLKMGDQILSVNGVNFRNIIREEAVLTLMGLPAGEEVNIIAQPQPKVYQKILEHGTGDSFYIRTHFKYEKSGDHEMSFKQGSAFRISDTLYQGMVGYWLAVRIGRNNMEIERGVIPNSSRAEQLKMVQDRKIAQMKERGKGGIGRRFGKNTRSDPPSIGVSSNMFPAYERVVLREAGFKRPVVIFGPLADIARERLAADYATHYEVARNEGTVSGQKSNRKGVIRLNTIKDIIEKDKHAVLDITPTAVQKLNYAQLYPIVVFLEPQSKATVKELRAKLACTEQEKKKKPGKLYDRATKMQRGYSHVFTDTIRLSSGSDDWYRKLYSTIKDQQSTPVWVSEDKLGGGGEEDTEGVTVPGDDDQFSYVSAPASDYSVTTVGSEMLNSSRMSDDEEEDLAHKYAPKAPASSSDEKQGNKFGDEDFDDALNEFEDEPPVEKPASPMLEPEPMPAAPPREKKLSKQASSATSSSSSSEEEPPPLVAPKPPSSNRVITKVEPPRGRQEIPAGRFDPQSFLKNHIRGLNKTTAKEENPRAQQGPPPPVHQPIRSVAAPVAREQPPPQERPQPSQAPRPEAVYAQVNKNRPTAQPQQQQQQPEPQPQGHPRESMGRDYASEIDNFISNDPYRRNPAQDNRNIPDNRYKEPTPQPAQPTQYNRFAGSSQAKAEPKPYQPYSANKPQEYRPPVSNGFSNAPPKSKFVQEKYKDYMSQIKPSSSTSYNSAYNPRPYKPSGFAPVTTSHKNGPLKEHMYDSGVDTYDNAKPKQPEPPVLSPIANDEDDPQVVATARGMFDSNGGVLSSVETGVSIVIPKGAIRPGVRQEIYFKVCRDNTALPPLDKDKGETLLSPLVMCGPHGLQFEHPVELRLPHCEPSQWQNVSVPSESNNYDVGSNSVSVLIDHF